MLNNKLLCLAAPEFRQEFADLRIMFGKGELQERIVVVEAVAGFGHLGEKGPFIQEPRMPGQVGLVDIDRPPLDVPYVEQVVV